MSVFELNKETNTKVTVFLLKDIKDIKSLKKQIVCGELDCCGLRPSLIINSFHLLIAANKAACSEKDGALRTKSLNTELLFNLSISKNIKQALNEFGVNDDDQNAVIVIFEKTGEKKFEHIKSHFEGKILGIEEFNELADIELIKKTYKVTDRELEVSHLIDSVASRISTKDFGSY